MGFVKKRPARGRRSTAKLTGSFASGTGREKFHPEGRYYFSFQNGYAQLNWGPLMLAD